MKALEPLIWVAVLAMLSGAVIHEGRREAELERKLPLAPKALYDLIAKSQTKLQILDVRPDPDENYEDTHVPGALPFPGCSMENTPPGARDRILRSVPTIIVSEDGDPALFATCAAFFTNARNLEGGLEGWTDVNLPEDSGEYVPPKPGAGGGCL